MGRKETTERELKLRQKQSEHLSVLLSNEHITQTELGKRTGYTQQHYSNIIGMKSSLSEENAELIKKAFPDSQYRKEWLLGFDDYVTEGDVVIARFKKELNQLKKPFKKVGFMTAPMLWFLPIANKMGFQYSFAENAESNNTLFLEHEGNRVCIKTEQLDQTINEIAEFIEFKLINLMNKEQ